MKGFCILSGSAPSWVKVRVRAPSFWQGFSHGSLDIAVMRVTGVSLPAQNGPLVRTTSPLRARSAHASPGPSPSFEPLEPQSQMVPENLGRRTKIEAWLEPFWLSVHFEIKLRPLTEKCATDS